MAEKILLALSTFPDAEIARRISNQLVSERFAACANIFPSVESIYRWKDKIESGNETLVLFKAQRRSAIGVSGQTAIASSIRCPRDHFRSSRERTAGIPAVGLRELPLGALTFLASQVNCDADRVRDCGHDNDFRGETQRAWYVNNWIDSKKNRGITTQQRRKLPLRATRSERATESHPLRRSGSRTS